MSHPDERLGMIVGGKYRISRFLAEGGMGTVYEAQHLVVKRRFAVKFLRSELAQRRDMLARFKLEAESAGSLESENVAAALDFGVTNQGAPYLVMEYLDGISLADLLSSHGPLPVERAADLVVQTCAGIQRAHDAGVMHRDLKPRNLFVCRRSDGTDLVKIVDFGVAKLLDQGAASGLTATGAMVGTPSYMSPEQARGEALIDRRADVYSLGVILYELLTGHQPHPGDSYNAIIHHISTQPPLPLERREPALPTALIEIVMRALASHPDRRPASAAELARALDEFCRRRPWPALSSATSPSVDSTLLAPAAPAAGRGLEDAASSAPLDSSGMRSPRRMSRLRLTLGGLLASAAISGAVLWPSRRAWTPPAVARPAAPMVTLVPELPQESVQTRPADVQALDTNLKARWNASAVVSQQPLKPPPKPKGRSVPPPLSLERARARNDEAPHAAAPTPAPTVATKLRGAAEFDSQNPY
jgi:serine/threonine protein kinase